MTLQVSKVTFG